MVDWSRYDSCETCDAPRGEQCYDMRLVRLPNARPSVRVAIPHKGRRIVDVESEGIDGAASKRVS